MEMKRYYFENSILCGNCNGTGLQGRLDYCRACSAKGIDSFEQYARDHKHQDLILLHIKYNEALKQFI